MLIVPERYERLKRQFSIRVGRHIREMAHLKGITLSAVLVEYPRLLPTYLRPLAAACFVPTVAELFHERRRELSRELRHVDRQIKRLALIDAPPKETP